MFRTVMLDRITNQAFLDQINTPRTLVRRHLGHVAPIYYPVFLVLIFVDLDLQAAQTTAAVD